MTTTRVLLALVAAALLGSAPRGQQQQAGGQPHCLFSFFRDNGQDGLHLAHSRDGLKWFALNIESNCRPARVTARRSRCPRRSRRC